MTERMKGIVVDLPGYEHRRSVDDVKGGRGEFSRSPIATVVQRR
jgi:hypothetical protein